MAPTVTEVYEATWTSTTSPRTTGTLTVAQGDVLYVIAGGSASNGALTLSDSTSSAIAWTATSLTTSGYSPVYLWTATIPSGVTSLTITLTRASGSSYYGFNVFRATNCSGVGTPVTGSGTSGGPSLAITTGQSNSVIAYASSDYNSVSVTSRTWRQVNSSDPTEDYVARPSSSYYLAHYGDAGAAGSKTTGLSAPTGQKWQAIAVELLPGVSFTASVGTATAAGGTTSLVAAPAATIVATAGTATATGGTTSLKASSKLTANVGAAIASGSTTVLRRALREGAHADALADRNATVSARAELVDLSGNSVQWLAADGTPLYPTLTEATVEMAGEIPEQWSLRSATLTDPRWVPKEATDPLDPRSPLAIKLWYGVEIEPGIWGWTAIGVYRPTRPRITDDGTVSVSFTGRDLLSVAMQGGYGGQVLDLGGLTVDQALRRIFAAVAPQIRFSAPVSTITLPGVYQVGRGKPFDDWTKVAELAGWIVRADADGVIVAGPPPSPSTPALILAEGRDCIVDSVTREISEATYNRVVVIGTHPDLTAPVVGVAEDSDPASPTYVGLGNVRELTIESDAVSTVEAANNMAAMNLGRYLRPTETVTARIPAHPELRYRDMIPMARRQAGIVGDYRLSKWTLALPIRKPELMEVTMMSRQVAR